MTDRGKLADAFLAQTEWGHATRAPLAGDASNRRYERLSDPKTGAHAVLMDAPVERGEDIRPFVRIAEYLIAQGLSAPRILAQSEEHGFLLLEDLGDDLFARVLERDASLENQVYTAATDALVALHRADMPSLDAYDAPLMTELAGMAYTWYQAGIVGTLDQAAHEHFTTRMENALIKNVQGPKVLVQRDYHAENLLWLPDRSGIARVGMLDFQDAMAGHPAYDLVSLLQDARRDVPAAIEMRMLDHYITAAGVDAHDFRTAYAVLGAQRNLRIIGIFAKLCLDRGKPHYIDLIPRVWGYMEQDLADPALAQVAELIQDTLPRPTQSNLQRLKDQCPTP